MTMLCLWLWLRVGRGRLVVATLWVFFFFFGGWWLQVEKWWKSKVVRAWIVFFFSLMSWFVVMVGGATMEVVEVTIAVV